MGGERPPGGGAERFEPGALSGLPPELALTRLPPGRHGLPRSFVADQQRLRIVAAMLRVLPSHGYPATTIGHIAAEAGVSRSAFYTHFEGKEDCFLATHDLAAGWFCERVGRAADAAADWPGRVRAGVAGARDLLVANHAVAHLFAVEALQAGGAARERREDLDARFALALRGDASAHPAVPAEVERLLLGGAISLIAGHVDSGRVDDLEAALAILVDSLLVPYLDPRSAAAQPTGAEHRSG